MNALARLRWIPFALAAVAVLLLPLSGLGTRAGFWEFPVGFSLLKWAAYAGLAAAAVGVVLLLVPGARAGAVAKLAVAAVAGLAVAYVPWSQLRTARTLPPIHDISTDTEQPPAFVAVLPLRANAKNPAEYGGPEIAAKQHEGYPDIAPRVLRVPPREAFARAAEAAQAMGWEMVAADTAAGRIEATATTPWFGFKDDVVVRVAPAPEGSRIDVRSVSRVGGSDVGANAARIRKYLARLGS